MAYGYYQSMQELIKAANKALSRNVSDNIKLTYNAFTGKVTVQIKNGFQFAVMKPLSIILGFGGKDVILKKNDRKPLRGRLDDRINNLRIPATLWSPKSSETRALNYSKVFLPKGSLVTLLLKRLPTFSTCRFEQNPLRPWKLF